MGLAGQRFSRDGLFLSTSLVQFFLLLSSKSSALSCRLFVCIFYDFVEVSLCYLLLQKPHFADGPHKRFTHIYI
jgi:hypothetical protein